MRKALLHIKKKVTNKNLLYGYLILLYDHRRGVYDYLIRSLLKNNNLAFDWLDKQGHKAGRKNKCYVRYGPVCKERRLFLFMMIFLLS